MAFVFVFRAKVFDFAIVFSVAMICFTNPDALFFIFRRIILYKDGILQVESKSDIKKLNWGILELYVCEKERER